jgi:hypothetical protein
VPQERNVNATKESIVAAIQDELSAGEIDNAHGITSDNIQAHLVEPRLETFGGLSDETPELDLWVVLEEYPGDIRGYLVTYDPTNASYGLAVTSTDGKGLYIGAYGSFLKALNSM